jgi:uncharacterized cupin superfamily protein
LPQLVAFRFLFPMKTVHIPSLPEEEVRSPTGKFRSFCKNISIALGGVRNAGTWGGGHPFDLQIRRLPPGAVVCPFHSHLGQWELFVVRAGAGTVRAGAETHAVKTGDVFFHPPGEPHQLINTGATDLEVFIIADNPPLDACFYPDSNKWALRPPGKLFRITEVDYFDGEEPAVPGAPPYRPSGSPPAPTVAPFANRKLHPDDLPWVPWASPKGKFRGTSKELSIALGALRHTPTGLGGHPFDLELSKLAPGECGCPFHRHTTQWEMFVILDGSGTVRTADGPVAVNPDDVLLHAPGEAHQLTNTGNRELVFFLIADNPPLDVWHYPDTGKWGHSSPRKIFHATDLDYWDGEE